MKLILPILLTILLFTSSCASLYNGDLTFPETQIGKANFKIIHTGIYGEASAFYILGIGGLSQSGLYSQAKQKMNEQYSLAGNQIFTNYTIDRKHSLFFYPLFTR